MRNFRILTTALALLLASTLTAEAREYKLVDSNGAAKSVGNGYNIVKVSWKLDVTNADTTDKTVEFGVDIQILDVDGFAVYTSYSLDSWTLAGGEKVTTRGIVRVPASVFPNMKAVSLKSNTVKQSALDAMADFDRRMKKGK